MLQGDMKTIINPGENMAQPCLGLLKTIPQKTSKGKELQKKLAFIKMSDEKRREMRQYELETSQKH